jgi:hypothetical protein
VPIPSVYDEAGLATFLLAEARSVAAAFGWASQADVQEVINETLLAYGSISDISGATDIRKLRVIARYYIWKAAVEQAAGKIPVSIGGQRWDRDRLQQQALAAFNLAKDAASIYIADIESRVDTSPESIQVAYIGPPSHDPYRAGRWK